MSFVSTGNKSVGNRGPAVTTPPIAGESGGMSAGSAATSGSRTDGRAAKGCMWMRYGWWERDKMF
ncbi:hypothetical protein DBY68_022230 [Pseudocitrobacter sp. RIT415]|nr:hypothetical protein DBY68_022230 [Pseudocitrobacter sp. RIT 415]